MNTINSGSVTQLYRYPVKSMQGEKCQQLVLHRGGIVGDRAIALQDVRTGKLVTAKQPVLWKGMLQLVTHQHNDGSTKLTFPTGEQVLVTDQNAAQMLSDYLGRSVKILFSRPDSVEMDRADPDEVIAKGTNEAVGVDTMPIAEGAPDAAFVDYGAIHLVTTTSLLEVGRHSLSGSSEPERFRPNIVIDFDVADPFCENDWVGKVLCIGNEVKLKVTLPTPRCALPTLAQPAIKPDTTLLGFLKQVNAQPFLEQNNLPSLGVYADVLSPGRIRTDDLVSFDNSST